jgi:hypothetical protein
MKKLFLFIPILVLLTACGLSQADLDAANQRAAQAEQIAAVQAQRAAEANQRADEYWWQAKWNAATNPERMGIALAGMAAMGLFGLLGYGMYALVVDAPSRRAHEYDLREQRIREMQAANERAALILAARQTQLRQQAELPYDRRLAQLQRKYGTAPRQLTSGGK